MVQIAEIPNTSRGSGSNVKVAFLTAHGPNHAADLIAATQSYVGSKLFHEYPTFTGNNMSKVIIMTKVNDLPYVNFIPGTHQL